MPWPTGFISRIIDYLVILSLALAGGVFTDACAIDHGHGVHVAHNAHDAMFDPKRGALGERETGSQLLHCGASILAFASTIEEPPPPADLIDDHARFATALASNVSIEPPPPRFSFHSG